MIGNKRVIVPSFYTSHSLPPPSHRKWTDYPLYPYHMARLYFKRLIRVFGFRFLLFLCASQFFLKGMAAYMTMSIMLPLLKNVFGLSGSKFQVYTTVALVPWSIKPLLGLLSDFLLFCGYHKRVWLLSGLGVGCVGTGLLFLMYQPLQSAIGVTLCLCGVQYQVALFDLLSEATYSSWMRKHPYTGTDIVTLVQGYQHAGGLIAMSFVGVMADNQLFYGMFIILAIFVCIPLLPTLLGWLPEERYPNGRDQGAPTLLSRMGISHIDVTHEAKLMMMPIAFTGLTAPIAALVSVLLGSGYGMTTATLFITASMTWSYFVLPPLVFRVALYQVLTTLSQPDIGGALDYFYTADAQCLPNGPAFSFAYYMTYAGLVGTASAFIASGLYQVFLGKFKFRTVFLLTVILRSLVGLSDIFIVTRFNLSIGIPDKTAYMIGEAVMEPVLITLNYIPGMILLSRACLEGMESSIFAYLAGINNFAGMISGLSGAFIFQAAGIRTKMPCNFDSLWILVLICHAAAPLLVGIGCNFLIPKGARQTDNLDAEGNVAMDEEEEGNDANDGDGDVLMQEMGLESADEEGEMEGMYLDRGGLIGEREDDDMELLN